jgi:glutathione S-transferase
LVLRAVKLQLWCFQAGISRPFFIGLRSTRVSDVILHHFDTSPFAEKIRLALGLKGLAWYSIEIPMVMPKPELTALTGGYRKTPVMQIGGFPEPTLFPAHSEGLAMALSQWSDAAFFQPGAGLSMGTNTELPEDILADRREFFNFMDFSTLPQQIPHFYAQFRGQLQLIETMLADDRPYVLSEQPGWADILAYFPLWMARGNITNTDELVQSLPRLRAWELRMQEIGHGDPSPLDAKQAIRIARETETTAETEISAETWPALSAGIAVTVKPQDYGAVPVAGELLRLTQTDIAIHRQDPRAGSVVVHFPRLGYTVEVAS